MGHPIPAGYHAITPHLVIKGAAEAIEFYKRAFGAVEMCRMPAPSGKIMHAAIMIEGDMIFLCDDFPEFCPEGASSPKALGGSAVAIHRYVSDCDAAIHRAQEAGATVKMPAADMFWGDRYGSVADPFGHKWAFATRIREMSPEEMMEASRQAFAQPTA